MIKVRVPATSANMGPGFDTMGVAFNMYNHFYIQEAEELSITGCPKEDANEGNLLYRSMIRCLEMLEFPTGAFISTLTAPFPYPGAWEAVPPVFWVGACRQWDSR